MALLPSAVSADGSGQAASVTAAGGNKARVKQGVGTFKDVFIGAEQAGEYVLKAKPSSREVRQPLCRRRHDCLSHVTAGKALLPADTPTAPSSTYSCVLCR